MLSAFVLWTTVLCIVLNHEIAVERLPALAPIIVPDGVVYQTTDYSCGPACLATIFRNYNIIASEREWADIAGTMVATGTQLPGLRRAGDSVGFESVELNPTWDQLSLIIHPAIIFESREYHLVTYWGKDENGNAIIRDPVLGKTSWGPAEYAMNTPGRPIMLVYYPGPIPTCEPSSPPVEVARFQNMLKATGHYRGAVSGRWTNSFSGAIKAFQDDMNIEQTGIIDAPTSIYLEGAWRISTRGPVGPLMGIDRADGAAIHAIPILTEVPDGR
jgi:hypothetical protein